MSQQIFFSAYATFWAFSFRKTNNHVALRFLIPAVALVLHGCGERGHLEQRGRDILISHGETQISFRLLNSFAETYRVMSLKLERNAELGRDVVTLVGLPVSQIPEKRPFTTTEVRKAHWLYMIPTTDSVRRLAKRITENKGCWWSVTVRGVLMKPTESSQPEMVDGGLNFVYLEHIDSKLL